ncbi:hypothetical protein M404DRAFT_1007907 [Pisolithus tinctorius Marx 270]|uniref:Uncharacterized protein n=1 Tax=Pisolithus tinctorius Marx 270 TaxID=870435 RepID=A0A0C3NHI1_PISTI|nr:hypothetical protein M404DRAFT_1007907 [Pisolithus tinctorius Marx 270]
MASKLDYTRYERRRRIGTVDFVLAIEISVSGDEAEWREVRMTGQGITLRLPTH